jgi:hypothetical protein
MKCSVRRRFIIIIQTSENKSSYPTPPKIQNKYHIYNRMHIQNKSKAQK